MRSKVILSVLVCLALLLSLGVAVKEVKADAIMFPWIIKNTGVTSTLISVVNTAGVPVAGVYAVSGVPFELHYEYWWKTGGQTDVCDEWDFRKPTSKDDIVTFDAAGYINNGNPLFNDNINNVPYGSAGFDLGVGVPSPARAYLIVDNNTQAFQDLGFDPLNSDINLDGTMYGEAMIINLTDGSSWGYIAYNASGGEENSANAPVDFSDGMDLLGEVLANTQDETSGNIAYTINPQERAPVVLMPPASIKTKFFMTPTDADFGTYTADTSIRTSDDPTDYNQRKGNINARIQLMFMTSTGVMNGGIYDNDENVISFTRPKDIVCTSADFLSALIDAPVFENWKAEGTQGWAFLITKPGVIDKAPQNGVPDNPEMQMLIGKLEYSDDTQAFVIGSMTIAGTDRKSVV